MKENDLKHRLLLASFPIIIVLIVLEIEVVVRQHLLFTSLISSVFLIYLKPKDSMNDTLTIAISQVLAALTGYAFYSFFGVSYWVGASTLIVVTLLLVALNRFHPPAITTSLIFNYRTHQESDLTLFLLLLGLIILLFFLKEVYGFIERKLIKD